MLGNPRKYLVRENVLFFSSHLDYWLLEPGTMSDTSSYNYKLATTNVVHDLFMEYFLFNLDRNRLFTVK